MVANLAAVPFDEAGSARSTEAAESTGRSDSGCVVDGTRTETAAAGTASAANASVALQRSGMRDYGALHFLKEADRRER